MPCCIDDQPSDGFGVAQLRQQLLADDEPWLRAAAPPPPLADGRAARDGLERQRRQIVLQAVGQQLELVLFALLQLFADEDCPLGKRDLGESARPQQHGMQGLALMNRILAREAHLARQLDVPGSIHIGIGLMTSVS